MGRKAVAGGGIGSIVLVLVALYFGVDPSAVLNLTGGGSSASRPASQQLPSGSAPTDTMGDFVSVVLADTEDVWTPLFQRMGRQYKRPKLVLFTGAVESACGFAQAAMGPFYCPADQKVYIDLSFYEDLKTRYRAPGDFAQAYVIAHEVGHHVQTLLGISQQVHQKRRVVSKTEANQLSVRMELQADCLAGIWAHHAHKARQILESGDVEEALGAASAIGDDRMQQRSRGYITPDSFTHGSSEQRVRWFKKGLQSGDPGICDTFSQQRL